MFLLTLFLYSSYVAAVKLRGQESQQPIISAAYVPSFAPAAGPPVQNYFVPAPGFINSLVPAYAPIPHVPSPAPLIGIYSPAFAPKPTKPPLPIRAPSPAPPLPKPLKTKDPESVKPDEPVDVYYVTELLDRFRQVTTAKRKVLDHRHTVEIQKLNDAIYMAPTDDDRWALEQAVTGNEELHKEAHNAFDEMENFANTLKQVLGARGTTKSCKDLTCGNYAYCKKTEEHGAVCTCDDGYEGDGFICHVPTVTKPQSFIEGHVQAYDMDLTVYNGTRNLACVYRDESQKNAGFLTLGVASPVTVAWSAKQQFTYAGLKAYQPVVAGLPSGRLAITFRDNEKSGNAYIVGAETYANGTVAFGFPFNFAGPLKESLQILPLPQNHVAVFYEDEIRDYKGYLESVHGNIGLYQIRAAGEVFFVGKFRFAEFAVSDIKATLLSVDEFVIAYRHVNIDPKSEKQEAGVMYGAFHDGELVLDPHALYLEPEHPGQFARDVQLLAWNIFAYGYYDAISKEVRVSIVEVHPETHQMKKVRMHVVGKGETPWVKGISLAYAPREPRTYFFYKNGITSKVSSCALLDKKHEDCTNSNWTDIDVQSVAAKSIGDSRVVFAFTDNLHIPHFQIMALA